MEGDFKSTHIPSQQLAHNTHTKLEIMYTERSTRAGMHEGYNGVNWQPSKGLNIYRQPRFREIFNRQMTNWQSSAKREIYSGQKKSWVWLRVTSLCGIKCQNARGYPGARNIWYLRRILLTKPLFYWYWQKGLNFSDNWQSHHPLVTLMHCMAKRGLKWAEHPQSEQKGTHPSKCQ